MKGSSQFEQYNCSTQARALQARLCTDTGGGVTREDEHDLMSQRFGVELCSH
jgi:hypothetical protein